MKKDYLSRLSRVARWRLGAKEAEEVIADYRDMVGDPPRTEEELMRDLGKPLDAVKPLVERKAYYIWLAVFTALAVCVLLPTLAPLPGMYGIWWCLAENGVPLLRYFLLAAGTALAFFWFRRQGQRNAGRLPRGILPFLLAELVFLAAAEAVFAWQVSYTSAVFEGEASASRIAAVRAFAPTVKLFLEWGPLIPGALALLGLVKARLGDRRWAAVYVLGLTAVVTALSAEVILCRQGIDLGMAMSWWTVHIVKFILLAVFGLVGTGVALC